LFRLSFSKFWLKNNQPQQTRKDVLGRTLTIQRSRRKTSRSQQMQRRKGKSEGENRRAKGRNTLKSTVQGDSSPAYGERDESAI
jgi:hypothetical protein